MSTPPPATSPLRIRPAVRALVLAPHGDVLLVRFEFPTGTRWALPGGGIDPGESPLDALRRELDEEVGLTDVEIGPHIWNREHHVAFVDGRWDGQREQIHLVRVPRRFDPDPRLDWEQLNNEFLHEIRWWHVDEIASSPQVTFVPATLHRHLRTLIDDGPPPHPVMVEV